jgi:hypothetical protein
VKWLIVGAILVFVGLRVFIFFRPDSPLARVVRRRYLLRTDAHAMSRRQLVLSALSFLGFACGAVGLYLGVRWGGSELGWRIFEARPIVVLAKAGLFVGAMAVVACLFLVGAAIVRRPAA